MLISNSYKRNVMNNAIGKRLKSAREAAGLNQVECAKAAGISQPYLAQIEAGNKQPTTEVLRRLASAVRVSFAWLLDNVRDDHQQSVNDPRLAMMRDELAAPGLRNLAKDEAMCDVLEISSEEWAALRSIVLSDPPDKHGYLLLLYAVRAVIQRAA